jgi:SOS-response transcriptional repressor LexA
MMTKRPMRRVRNPPLGLRKEPEHMTNGLEPLTARQQEVLECIREKARMYGPTVREIASQLGIKSPNGVVCHLETLERKGYIRRSKKIARGIEVVA